MTEREFTDAVVELAGWFRWRVAHFRPAQTERGWRTPMQGDKGFPDLALAKQGVVILAELKSDTGKYGEGQQEWAEAIGAQHRLWRPRDMAAIREELEHGPR